MIFVDTSAWVALYVGTDRFHSQADAFWRELRRRSIPVLSTFDVFGETLTVIRGRAGLPQALEFGEALLMEDGSNQRNLWGANYFPARAPGSRLEYTALINIRPVDENTDQQIQSAAIRDQVRVLVERFIGPS